jgi:F0F1-type ATP synthase membrane subunit c/vacuolar-type H+-ATPase subunit K
MRGSYNQRMNQKMVIWVAIVFSTVIYLVMALTLGGEPDTFAEYARDKYVPVLYGLALVTFLFGWFVVPRVIKSSERLKMICAMAIFEASAIFGLIAAFLTKDWRMYLLPWALSLVGFFRERPRSESAELPLRE